MSGGADPAAISLDPSQAELAQTIISRLGVNAASARQQVERVVALCGTAFAQGLLEETLQVEASGGMLVKDGSRRRDPVGVFFQLARRQIGDPRQEAQVFPPQTHKPSGPWKGLNAAQLELAQTIAQQLGETEFDSCLKITRLVKLCGADFARAVLEETLRVEASGGMLIHDGSRRRTPGGVFFYLARGRIPDPELQARLFPGTNWKARKAEQKQQRAEQRQAAPQAHAPALASPAPAPTVQGPDYPRMIKAALAAPQEARDMRLILTGHPASVESDPSGCMVLAWRHSARPKPGLPPPPSRPTVFLVYAPAKAWQRVAQALQADPNAELVVEGDPAFDPELGCMVVLAGQLSTRPAP